jgi:hypothetical protein
MIFIFFLLFKITIFNKKILNRQEREANHDIHKYFWKFFIVFKSIFQKHFKKLFFYFTLIL